MNRFFNSWLKIVWKSQWKTNNQKKTYGFIIKEEIKAIWSPIVSYSVPELVNTSEGLL